MDQHPGYSTTNQPHLRAQLRASISVWHAQKCLWLRSGTSQCFHHLLSTRHLHLPEVFINILDSSSSSLPNHGITVPRSRFFRYRAAAQLILLSKADLLQLISHAKTVPAFVLSADSPSHPEFTSGQWKGVPAYPFYWPGHLPVFITLVPSCM